MQPVTIEQILERNSNLSSLPASIQQLNELMQKERVNISEISEVVNSDPVLAARILKAVNSPFYGFPAKIDTISFAVTILGIDALRYLAITSTVVSNFSRNLHPLVPLDAFWRHSFATAVIAQQLGKSIAIDHDERLFTSGLLHEIGGLLMAMSAPDEYRQAIELANLGKLSLHDAENRILGFNHLDITADLLKQWNLPMSVSETIRAMHKQVDEETEYQQDSALLTIADAVATAIFPVVRLNEQRLKLHSHILQRAQIKPAQLNQILDDLDSMVEGVMDGMFMEMAA